MSASSASLLLAAVMVGFAAAWLVIEVRRAWSPEAVRAADHDPGAVGVTEEVTQLVEEVTRLRQEIAAVRASEIETALRNRKRQLELAGTLAAAAAQSTEPAEQPAPVPEECDTDSDVVTDDLVPHSRVGSGGRS